LRARLAEAEARAAAAEQRLEEVGSAARQRLSELEDAQERLRLADAEVARERRNVARLEEEIRTAASSAQAVVDREKALVARDERIARLESEKQDLVWRLAELEDKLTATIARAVRSEAVRGATGQPDTRAPEPALPPRPDAGDEARLVRERALDEF